MKSALMILVAVAVVLGLTVAALFPMAWGVVHSDISVAAFGVAGAIVALVLPASSLARDAAQRVVDTYIDRTAKAMGQANESSDTSLSAAQWATAGVAQVGSLRVRAAAARYGSGFVYVGFLLSMFSLLQVADPVIAHIGRQPIRPWHVAVGGALACLAVGAVLFLPLAWWFWTPRLLETSAITLQHFAQPVTKDPEPAPVAPPPTPAAPSPPRPGRRHDGVEGTATSSRTDPS